MQRTGQKALNEAHAYAAGWKQPINFPKTEWQGIHRQVVLPTLSLSLDRPTSPKESSRVQISWLIPG